jgi:Xaa-Pro aminopeptidase
MTVPLSLGARLQRVREEMAVQGLAALVAFSPADCRYLTGFSGEAASVVLTITDAVLVTDSRFTVQAAEEIPGTRIALAENGRDDPVIQVLTEAFGNTPALSIGIDSKCLSVKRWDRLRAALEGAQLGWKLVDGPVQKARMAKFPDELTSMRAAGALAASAFDYLETLTVVGRSEIDVALDLEMFLRRNGSEGVPFTFIVAAGSRGAMPHGEASPAVIEPGHLVVFDIGAVVDGYASDITRTYATGPLDPYLLSVYDVVQKAQARGVAAAVAGAPCAEVDKVARDYLAAHGLGDLFVHSLGHGVGLEIHEGPSLSARSEDVLEPGMVVTVEPGVYLAGRAGIRIEDTIVVTPAGPEVLTEYPRELRYLK